MFKTIRQAHKLDIRFETPQSKSSAHAAQGKRVLVVGIDSYDPFCTRGCSDRVTNHKYD